MKASTLGAISALCLAGCTPGFVEQDQASVLVSILQITASAGGPKGEEGVAFLLSDVVNVDETTGVESVFNDNAVITVHVESKDPLVDLPGSFNNVQMKQYRVRFTRADGHNAEGIDVPYGFSGPLNITAPVGADSEVPILLVRHEAKLEPPLRNLRGTGGLGFIQAVATITVYGSTLSGKTVTASGDLGVTFGDFSDK